ncbi:translocation/assembly module TamB [Dysgonomonas sp. 25]|nr:translocation/assembly module TamB domain-containing protein [Dysgonomonas sp. 25]NDV67549.1 translocation/assembly module TamB [Dysgonomonas sp. 25]
MRDTIVEELHKKIGTELGIGQLHFTPFNALELDSVYLHDVNGEQIFFAEKIYANVDILPLLQRKLVVNAAHLTKFDIYLSKDSANSPLNIQYVIDAFKSDTQQSNATLQIKLNAISLSEGSFRYDVKDKPRKEERFDANHIYVSDLDGRFALKSLTADSLNIQIKKLNLKEQSGLKITNLTSRLVTQDKKASIRGFRLDLPDSFLQFDKCEVDLSNVATTKDLLDNATFDCIITPSYIAPKDVAAFTPALRYFTDLITLQARITGSVDNINIQDLQLNYGEKMQLISNIEIKDTRFADKMYILGSIDELTMTGTEIEGLRNNFSKNNIRLPNSIRDLNLVSFEGDISGYLNQLTAFGSLESDLGIVNTDVLFGFDADNGATKFYLQGGVYASNFQIGRLLSNKDLGKVSVDLEINMKEPKNGGLQGSAVSIIRDMDYKGYTYADAAIDFTYDGLKMEGKLNIDDPNGMVAIEGLFDLSDKENPELDFFASVKNVKMGNLHLTEKMDNSDLSFSIDANFQGKNIDDAQGYIKIDSIDFFRGDQHFFLQDFLIEASGISTDRKLTIQSDLFNGEVLGAYSFTTMASSIQQTLHAYLPALVRELKSDEKKRADIKDNNMNFHFQINNTEKLSSILNLPVTVVNQSKITGFYNNRSEKFRLEVFTPFIKAAGMNIKSGYVLVENPKDKINSQIEALILGKNNAITKLEIASDAENNEVSSKINFSNDGKQKAKGEFSLSALFAKEGNDPLNVDINILPSSLLMNNAQWNLYETKVSIKKDWYNIRNFKIETEDKNQNIFIDGTYAKNDSRQILKTELKNIDLHYIFETLAIDVLKFGGRSTGRVFVSSTEGKPYANTRLNVDDFSFNGTPLGHLNLFSEFDEDTKKIMMSGVITSAEKKITNVDGEIDPIKQGLSMNFEADSLDISFLNAYTSSLFNNVSGRGSGKVRLFGNFSKVTVEGDAFVEDGRIGINFLNTQYSFTDSVHLKSDLIYFNDIAFHDDYGNTAYGNGKVAHNMFTNISYHIDLSAENFLLYNATEKHNPIFSGKVFGTGNGVVSGDEQAVVIDVNIRTENKTEVRMNFMDNSITEYNFITYKSKDEPKAEEETDIQSVGQPIQTKSPMDIDMRFYIDATPDAVVELVMDPVGGDVLRGSGTGALRFNWSTKAPPRLYGNYLINRGSYLFTFQRLLERKFVIEDESTVRFDGDPFEAMLNVNAVYKITANLNDLSSSLAETSGQSNIPVNCILNLTGPLRRPTVKLDLAFPAAVPEVERQIKVYLDSEDMINRQVAYLLLLSKFYTPANSETEYRTTGFASVASATLSSQLTQIVSKLDNRWQLGTNIRTSDSEMTSTEVELILSSQLLNDRLLINGNFGYRDDPTIEKDAFIRDIEIEYLLNKSGTWRVKAYNRYNEKYYYHATSAEETQGVGIKYKRDFDKVSELLPWKREPKEEPALPADTLVPIIPDSIQKGSPLSSFIKLK